jgi:hypothetical protein
LNKHLLDHGDKRTDGARMEGERSHVDDIVADWETDKDDKF